MHHTLATLSLSLSLSLTHSHSLSLEEGRRRKLRGRKWKKEAKLLVKMIVALLYLWVVEGAGGVSRMPRPFICVGQRKVDMYVDNPFHISKSLLRIGNL